MKKNSSEFTALIAVLSILLVGFGILTSHKSHQQFSSSESVLALVAPTSTPTPKQKIVQINATLIAVERNNPAASSPNTSSAVIKDNIPLELAFSPTTRNDIPSQTIRISSHVFSPSLSRVVKNFGGKDVPVSIQTYEGASLKFTLPVDTAQGFANEDAFGSVSLTPISSEPLCKNNHISSAHSYSVRYADIRELLKQPVSISLTVDCSSELILGTNSLNLSSVAQVARISSDDIENQSQQFRENKISVLDMSKLVDSLCKKRPGIQSTYCDPRAGECTFNASKPVIPNCVVKKFY